MQKINVAAVTASLLLVGVGTWFCLHQPDPAAIAMAVEGFEPYQDRHGTVVRLSNEENYPFRLYGRTLEQIEKRGGHARGRRFVPLVKQYPSVLSCLKAEQRQTKAPDLSQVDWRNIDSTDKAALCVFRVAASYEGVDDLENWLKGQGFDVKGRRDVPSTRHDDWTTVYATRSGGDIGQLFYTGWLDRIFEYPMTLNAVFDDTGLWVEIDVGITRK